jgi:hypothetical protein
MKRFLVASLVTLTAVAAADDVADAKKLFEQYVEYRNSGDLRVLELISPKSEFVMVQHGDGFEISTPSPNHRERLESAMKKKLEQKEVFEEVEFRQIGKTFIIAEGTCQPTDGEFKGPFRMLLDRDEAGAMKITRLHVPAPITYTTLKGHGIMEFKMPGEWDAKEIEKVDIGEGDVILPGAATSMFGGLNYMAFEYGKTKPSEMQLEAMPMAAAGPLLARFEKQGLKESGRSYMLLDDANPDQGYYTFTLAAPNGDTVYMSGLVLRTKRRMYVIQQIGPSIPGADLYSFVAKGFKEL